MDDLERNIQEGYAVCRALRKVTEGSTFGNELRNVLACSFFSLALEHQQSVLVLTGAKLHGSAFALVRPLYEASIRGLWVKACAEDSLVREVERGGSRAFRSVRKMVGAVEERYSLVRPGEKIGVFGKAWINSSGAMHDYVHGAVRALSRRFDGGVVKPNYADEETIEVIRFCTTTTLILARCFFAVMSCRERADEVQRLMALYFRKVGLRRAERDREPAPLGRRS